MKLGNKYSSLLCVWQLRRNFPRSKVKGQGHRQTKWTSSANNTKLSIQRCTVNERNVSKAPVATTKNRA